MKNLIQSVLILIAVLMSTTGAEEVIYAQVGDTVTLQAPVVNSQKYVHWLFDKEDGLMLAWLNSFGGRGVTQDEPWKQMLSLSGNSLTITNIQKEFGTYFCKMTSNTQVVLSITTYKLVKLSVRMSPASPLLPGDPLSLDCNVRTPESQNKPNIHWLNPRKERVNNNQGTLLVTATRQDSGRWTCVVTNGQKKQEAVISVTVVDLSPAPLRQYTSTTSPLAVPCSIPSDISWDQIKEKGVQEVQWHFSPKPSSSSDDQQRLLSLSLEDPLTWKADKDKGLRPAPDLPKGNLSLTRNRGKEDDRGGYTCSMTFKNGVTLNRTVHVEVLQITSSAGTEIVSGQRLNLSCGIGDPLPSDMQLRWFPPEKSSLPRSDHHPARLTIKEVGTGDSGKWRCELWQSNARLTSAAMILKIEPKVKLSMWMLVIICGAAVILILLVILTIILCRRRQRKMRHLRHRLCQCKNPKPKGFYRT